MHQHLSISTENNILKDEKSLIPSSIEMHCTRIHGLYYINIYLLPTHSFTPPAIKANLMSYIKENGACLLYNITGSFLEQKLEQSGLTGHTGPDLQHLRIEFSVGGPPEGGVRGVDKIAAVAKEAAAQLEEGSTALRLVFAVLLLIFLQLV